jgi:HPr kinase/phosphorylase
MSAPTVHATAVAIGDFGVLIRGPSGSGKSSLALRLIDEAGYGLGVKALRAKLVADDQVEILRFGDAIALTAPYELRNKIEVRGLGIRTTTAVVSARLSLVVDLVPVASIERMPEETEMRCELLGLMVKRIHIDGADPAAPARVRAALQLLVAKGSASA